MLMGVPYEYMHMRHPIHVWANIHMWGRTSPNDQLLTFMPNNIYDYYR